VTLGSRFNNDFVSMMVPRSQGAIETGPGRVMLDQPGGSGRAETAQVLKIENIDLPAVACRSPPDTRKDSRVCA
jgi:hypothetical protein